MLLSQAALPLGSLLGAWFETRPVISGEPRIRVHRLTSVVVAIAPGLP